MKNNIAISGGVMILLIVILIAATKCTCAESFTLGPRDVCKKYHNKDSPYMSESNRRCPMDRNGLPTCNGWIVAFHDNPARKENGGNPILYQLGPMDNDKTKKMWKKFSKCKNKLVGVGPDATPFAYSLLGGSNTLSPPVVSPPVVSPPVVSPPVVSSQVTDGGGQTWHEIDSTLLNVPVILRAKQCSNVGGSPVITANSSSLELSPILSQVEIQTWKIVQNKSINDGISRYVIMKNNTESIPSTCLGVQNTATCTTNVDLCYLLDKTWRVIKDKEGGYSFESEARIYNKGCPPSADNRPGNYGCLGFEACNTKAILTKVGKGIHVFNIEKFVNVSTTNTQLSTMVFQVNDFNQMS